MERKVNLASFRPSSATYLLQSTEDSELVRPGDGDILARGWILNPTSGAERAGEERNQRFCRLFRVPPAPGRGVSMLSRKVQNPSERDYRFLELATASDYHSVMKWSTPG